MKVHKFSSIWFQLTKLVQAVALMNIDTLIFSHYLIHTLFINKDKRLKIGNVKICIYTMKISFVSDVDLEIMRYLII